MTRRNDLSCAVLAWSDGIYKKILEIDADGNVVKYVSDEELRAIAQAAVDHASKLLSV